MRLSVNVVVVETLRVLPAVSIAVTDENGTSAGPAVKLLSVRGHPHEVSLTARFGGSTLFEFSETSPELTHSPLWHSAKLALRERYNKLDEFNESSIDLDTRIGLRTSERFKAGAMVQLYQVRADQSGVTLSPDDVDTIWSAGAVADYDTPQLAAGPVERMVELGGCGVEDGHRRLCHDEYRCATVPTARTSARACRHVVADAAVRRARCRSFIHRLRAGRQQHRKGLGIQRQARQEPVHQLAGVSLHGPSIPEPFASSASVSMQGWRSRRSAMRAPPGACPTTFRRVSSPEEALACGCICRLST